MRVDWLTCCSNFISKLFYFELEVSPKDKARQVYLYSAIHTQSISKCWKTELEPVSQHTRLKEVSWGGRSDEEWVHQRVRKVRSESQSY